MIARTSAIVRTSKPRCPLSARSPASIAYATDETGSAITANANANKRRRVLVARLPVLAFMRVPSEHATRGAGSPADQASRHPFEEQYRGIVVGAVRAL